MKWFRSCLALLLSVGIAVPTGVFASSHREAPITALDHKADITDLYAFVSYSANQKPKTTPSKVTLILNVDPLLGAGEWTQLVPVRSRHSLRDPRRQRPRRSGGYHFPDPLPDPIPASQHTRRAGGHRRQRRESAGDVESRRAPADSRFQQSRPESRQTYTVTMVRHTKGDRTTRMTTDDRGDDAQASSSPIPTARHSLPCPANNGPRTMDYDKLFDAGTYHLENGISVFAGTVDDPVLYRSRRHVRHRQLSHPGQRHPRRSHGRGRCGEAELCQ